MPEAAPEIGPETGIPREEKTLTPKEKIASGLKDKLARLRERGISLPAFRKRLEAQAKGEEVKGPEFEGVIADIQALVKAQLKERKELTSWDIPVVARETIEAISRDPSLPLENKERLERMKARLPEFEVRLRMGKISLNPERASEQLGRILAGEEGEKLAKAAVEVAAEEIPPEEKTPYPKPKPPTLGGGEKGGWGKVRLGISVAIVPAVVAATCILGREFMGRISYAVSPKGYEEGIKPRREAIQTKGAEALIIGRYLYRDLEGVEKQGERGKYLARLQLDKARDLIVKGAKIDGVWKKYELDQVKDPQVIARLIYDYQKEYPDIFNLNKIENLEKRKLVEQFLKEFEEKEVKKTGYKPSLRETAEIRARQRLTSGKARARKRVFSRRERGLT